KVPQPRPAVHSGRIIPWEGSFVMFCLYRGRIAAISMLTCAAIGLIARASFAAEIKDFSSTALTSTIAPASGEELLSTLASAKPVDVDWVLQDNRQTLPTHLMSIDSRNDSLRSGTLGTARMELPQVATPISPVSSGNVNDLLVPVPVLSLGWSIVLC